MAVHGAVWHVEWVGDEDPERLEAATVTITPMLMLPIITDATALIVVSTYSGHTT